jgi:predicted deacetylase
VQRCVLKVVPNWHGSHPLSESPSLVELLRSQLAVGSQLVLHGLEHRPHGPLRGTPWSRLRGTVFAPDAAEFLTLPPTAAARAVREGFDLLEEAGLPRPSTFCAPGWLLAGDTPAALASAGIHYLIGMFSVHDLQTARRRWLPAIGYMGASPGQEARIRLLNGIIRRTVLPRATVAKVYLHPQGGTDNAALCRMLERLAKMVGRDGWVPTTYAEMSREP